NGRRVPGWFLHELQEPCRPCTAHDSCQYSCILPHSLGFFLVKRCTSQIPGSLVPRGKAHGPSAVVQSASVRLQCGPREAHRVVQELDRGPLRWSMTMPYRPVPLRTSPMLETNQSQ